MSDTNKCANIPAGALFAIPAGEVPIGIEFMTFIVDYTYNVPGHMREVGEVMRGERYYRVTNLVNGAVTFATRQEG